MNPEPAGQAAVARVAGLRLRYRRVSALDDVSLVLPAGAMTGLIGPDGVGKSSLLAVLAGARRFRHGRVEVLGGDIRRAAFRTRISPRIAYMPQGLGRNLYPSLTVEENLQFFGRMFGLDAAAARARIDLLARSTGLQPFLARPAGLLSGGMKQKLGLCCALIHEPDLLILDEPTTGVDPLARVQFWELIAAIRRARPSLSVVVATAYMDEAGQMDWLVALDAGRVLAAGSPQALLARTGCADLERAFVALLPPERRAGRPRAPASAPAAPESATSAAAAEPAVEARALWRRFGEFVAVRDVSFRIARGEIFGFIGSNGCGKSTTMKMLTGLLAPSSGEAWVLGQPVRRHDLAGRRRVGYMSQGFSLYRELSVRQNLLLHARLFDLPEDAGRRRCADLAGRFGLEPVLDAMPDALPLGMRQRLSLAVALVHAPELLILDEPTSGVDPVARDGFWSEMLALSRQDGVTIFISTHFMNEAERCDRVALMHAGRVLACGAPAALRAARGAANLEQAFVAWLREADPQASVAAPALPPPQGQAAARGGWLRRAAACSRREALELWRDPVRALLATLGSLILMIVIGYGLNMDVEDLPYAVLDRDGTALSRDYALNLSGSRYFSEHAPLADYADLDRRMRSGELALAIEIPPGFGRALQRGRPVQVGAWIDGANPPRAETAEAYVQGMHAHWLRSRASVAGQPATGVETRFRYNPDVRSLPAMVPAIIALLLLNLPAMQAALAVVREKEMGPIVNLYVTPLRRSEFLLGKAAPYVLLAMLNFVLMTVLAVTLLGVPLKGSVAALTAAAFLFCICSTGIGLLASAFTRSQIAAIFLTMIGTMLPAIQFGGLINPVAALEGAGRVIGETYPASHMLTISRGVFSKGLGFADLRAEFLALLAAIPVILGLAILALPRQER